MNNGSEEKCFLAHLGGSSPMHESNVDGASVQTFGFRLAMSEVAVDELRSGELCFFCMKNFFAAFTRGTTNVL